jgi:hypothetical protein
MLMFLLLNFQYLLMFSPANLHKFLLFTVYLANVVVSIFTGVELEVLRGDTEANAEAEEGQLLFFAKGEADQEAKGGGLANLLKGQSDFKAENPGDLLHDEQMS